MCILSFMPANVPADITALRNGGLSNPHGHGWALIAKDERGREYIAVGKSMDLETALEDFRVAREEHPGGPALFHSRWATHGSQNEDNCHPFKVGDSPLTVVAHNGILPASAHPKNGDDRSDTRLFADEILCTRYRRLDKPRAFEALGKFCGTGNKLVILTIDPRYRRNAYVVNEHLGDWDKDSGIWHSNDAWRDEPYWYGKDYRSSYADIYTFGERRYGRTYGREQCYICGMGEVTASGYCNQCFSCEECCEYQDDCRCWEGDETPNLPAVRSLLPLSDRYWDRTNETVSEWMERVRRIREESDRIAAASHDDDTARIADAWTAKYGSSADTGEYCSPPQRQPSIGGMTDAQWEAMQFDM